jgi:hypothetical protein
VDGCPARLFELWKSFLPQPLLVPLAFPANSIPMISLGHFRFTKSSTVNHREQLLPYSPITLPIESQRLPQSWLSITDLCIRVGSTCRAYKMKSRQKPYNSLNEPSHIAAFQDMPKRWPWSWHKRTYHRVYLASPGVTSAWTIIG